MVRSRSLQLGLDVDFHKKFDTHVHVPEGATPKDGPSAGVAMVTALVSTLSKVPVRADVAMTGEITLRGRVLPIGGLKEKLLAALRGGIRTVLIPEENRKDLADIPANVTEDLEDHPGEMDRTGAGYRLGEAAFRTQQTGNCQEKSDESGGKAKSRREADALIS